MSPIVKAFFDEATYSYSYVVHDPISMQCAIIDSVLNFDYASGRTHCQGADLILKYVDEQALNVKWILETHVHADHISAAPYLQQKLQQTTEVQLAIGAQITKVQTVFGEAFNEGEDFARNGSQFDRLLENGDTIMLGALEGIALHTPGHTPACMTYVFDNVAFVGDTLFMPDYGTARCDFPGGDAATLYASIQKIFTLPNQTRLFMCHDYKAPDRDHYAYQTTVEQERKHNIHVNDGIEKEAFINMRNARDTKLSMPKLILPSVQVNMRAGKLPPPEENGTAYLKIPLNLF